MKSMVVLLSLLMSVGALAQRGMGDRERLVLEMNDHLKGFNILKLKQELKYQYPGISPRNLELNAVKLVAKSKGGKGKATLIVGQNASRTQTIGGHPADFHHPSAYTFSKLRLQNPSYDSKGKWQIELQGNIKIKRVVLIVKMSRTVNISIPMYGEQMRKLSLIRLKKKIKQQNPRIDLQSAELESVVMYAKSKHGKGEATLLVGQDVSYPATIPGRPNGFNLNAPRSFHQVVLNNPSYDSLGKWQIELRGNIKVDEIVVKVKLKRGGRGPVMQPSPRIPRTPRVPRDPRRPRRVRVLDM